MAATSLWWASGFSAARAEPLVLPTDPVAGTWCVRKPK